MDPLKVQAAIQRVLGFMSNNSLEVVTAYAHDLILDKLSVESRIIDEHANATKIRTRREKQLIDGKEVEVEVEVVEADLSKRGEVIDHLVKLRDMVASKETKVNVNNNSGLQIGNISTGGRNFESRLRRMREARGLKNEEDSVEAEIIEEAEFEDEEEDDENDEVTSDESSS